MLASKEMKKILLSLTLLLSGVLLWAGTPEKMQTLINQYRHQDGFDTISIGPLGMSLMKGIIRVSDDVDADDLAVLRSFDSIRRVTIVDFEEADETVRSRFTRKVEKLLSGMELILETKDDGDRLSIYGIDDGGRVRDCILYSPDCMLICVKGSVNLEQLLEQAHD